MSPPPRRLSFAVGTTLLSASLATGVAGCKKPPPSEPPHTNEGPQPDPAEETVNVAPEPDPDAPADAPADDGDEDSPGEPPEDEPHVNTVPDDAP